MLFSIRQQRVMAILTLKGMEHETIPLPDSTKSPKPNHTAAPSTAADSAAPSEASDEQSDDTAAAAAAAADRASAEADEGLDPRAQIVKASMDEAAKEVPAYLASIKQQAESWQVESEAAEKPADNKTDTNIIMAWLRHLATNPFWVRLTKAEKQADADAAAAAAASGAAAADSEPDDIPGFDDTEPLTEKQQKAAAKAMREEEQQQLQDEVQSQQRDRGPTEDSGESSDPKIEGVQRYMLSNPDFLSHIMENDVFDCHEVSGTGERHIKYIPRYPKFEVCSGS